MSEEDFKAMAMAVKEQFGDDQDLDLKAFAHIEDKIGRKLKPIEKASIRHYLDQPESSRDYLKAQHNFNPDKWK